eukprot:TRINITY_DN3892_c0_g2_i1.p5 TRINITY_DN3892_c0_g2~~TRINITY_DN3892_c0_g2_i1.p5  ORF type:complete len:105 (-),score=3.71 TRINITY_DN3892_c0_g2_i1:9-323(-)
MQLFPGSICSLRILYKYATKLLLKSISQKRNVLSVPNFTIFFFFRGHEKSQKKLFQMFYKKSLLPSLLQNRNAQKLIFKQTCKNLNTQKFLNLLQIRDPWKTKH